MEWSERIGRRIKLRDLHILLAVTQHKSLAKAADHLAISRPVVSKAVADLEHVLGVRLLERDRHGAEPTAYGVALLKRGTAIFAELRDSVKDMEFIADPTAGEMRIGCSPFLATSFVSTVIDGLAARYPRIMFHVSPTQTEALHRGLSERNLDFLITLRLGLFATEQLGFETLYNDSYVVMAGAQSHWARRRQLELAELVNESWALPPPDSPPGLVAAEAFRAARLEYPRATVFTVPAEMRISLLGTGRFLTILPASTLRFSTRRTELKILPVKLALARIPIGIVTLKNRALNPVSKLFIEHARKLAKPLAKTIP